MAAADVPPEVASRAPFAFSGDEYRRPAITRALARVIDPEMALNIVDLGLVYAVAVEGPVVSVTLTLTSAACPVGSLIVDDVKRELGAALGEGHSVCVAVAWDPPWTPARMSAKALVTMGWL
jgi:metal-sulfur cluster biosynthetic enzyme